ncbi:DNA-directed RNA polymerase subunit D [archaeon]|nr:DNA-directed RNA polymerase subunit D [archaeon]
MEIKVLEKKENELVFTISGIDEVFANTLRRLIVSEVPTLAIETVTFTKNNSPLYDEIIAHRLGLVPIKTDLKSYNLYDPEKKKSPTNQLNLTLEVKGPGTVTAGDLKSQDPKCIPVYPELTITELLKDQKLTLEAEAVLNKGKVHMKFSPGLVYYKHYPEISSKNHETLIKKLPEDLFKLEGKKITIKDLNKIDAAEKHLLDNKAEVNYAKDKFIFFIESWGQLSPKVMLNKALEILDDKLTEFEKKLEKAK